MRVLFYLQPESISNSLFDSPESRLYNFYGISKGQGLYYGSDIGDWVARLEGLDVKHLSKNEKSKWYNIELHENEVILLTANFKTIPKRIHIQCLRKGKLKHYKPFFEHKKKK